MSDELMVRPASELACREDLHVIPSTIADAGDGAAKRFFEFFTANIRNEKTRAAYHRAAMRFFRWCDEKRLSLHAIEPFHVAAYIEELAKTTTRRGQVTAKQTVKQSLAAIRMLFDYLILGQVMKANPASAVRGPSYSTKKGKTPILTEDEAKELIKSIDTESIVGLRDRAVISVLLYGFARVGATVAMNVGDYFFQEQRWWFRLHEKGSKNHDMPAHPKAEEYMRAYLDAARLWDDRTGHLFRTVVRKTKVLTENRMTTNDVYRMVRRRAADAGIKTRIGCHSFRATGITNYLERGGTLEHAQRMACHESTRTTKLYDRRSDAVDFDEVRRITI